MVSSESSLLKNNLSLEVCFLTYLHMIFYNDIDCFNDKVVQQDCTRPEEFYYYHEEDEYDEDEDDIEDDEDNEDEDIDYKYERRHKAYLHRYVVMRFH